MNESNQGRMVLAWIKHILVMSNVLENPGKRSLNPNVGGLGLILLSSNNKDNRDKTKKLPL